MRILKTCSVYLTAAISVLAGSARADITVETLIEELSRARAEVANAELMSAKLKADIEKLESVIKSDIAHLDIPKETKEEATHRCTAAAKDVKNKLDEVTTQVSTIAADVRMLKEKAAKEKTDSIGLETEREAPAPKPKETRKKRAKAEKKRATRKKASEKGKDDDAGEKLGESDNAADETLAIVEAALKESQEAESNELQEK